MNIEKMTTTLQEAIAEAQQIAVTRKHQEPQPEFLSIIE